MTINDFVEKIKGKHIYLNRGTNNASRVFVDYDGVIDFELDSGEEVSIGLLDEINRDSQVELTANGLFVCVTDREGFGDWWIYTNSEDAFNVY